MATPSKRRKLSGGEDTSLPATAAAVTAQIDTAPADIEKDNRRSLFVRSLPASVTTERLAAFFSESYPLKHATVVLDPNTKISRGFGFVTFTDAEDARAAALALNNATLDGRKIKVEVAESRNREVEQPTGGKAHSVNVKGQDLRTQRQEKQRQEQGDNQPPKLIVRNLPWSIKTSEDLSKLFLSYGKVKYAVVPKLAGKGEAQAGFGIVVLRGKKNAENAIAGVNGKEVDGRTLAVDWAVDKETWQKRQQDEAKQNGKAADITEEAAATSDESVAGGAALDEDEEDSEAGSDSEAASDDDEQDLDEFDEIDNAEKEAAEDYSDLNGKLDDSRVSNSKLSSDDNTIFIRNLPFTADDNSLYAHFKTNFGPLRYARVVYDHDTERSRGTGFVGFHNASDAKDCVRNAPKPVDPSTASGNEKDKRRRGELLTHSILQNEATDPTGKYTLEGRVLSITRALPKVEADRRADDNLKEREKRADRDKRRLYLLSEGTIARGSKLYNLLNKTELDIRESSAKQRQKLIKENPNLGISLTRLSVRNLPRFVDGKMLKQLAREAIVGFATDVKEGKRERLSHEEVNRGGEELREAEQMRREKGKGAVKQTKIVYESEMTGGKVGEGKGGRSRGYGFIEYYGHRHALMGLRWLNGHMVRGTGEDGQDKGKRLIVEFAIENAQVLQRRADREKKARFFKEKGDVEEKPKESGRKRKRGKDDERPTNRKEKTKAKDAVQNLDAGDQQRKNKIAMRNRVISQKRQKRKMRRG